MNNDDLKNFDPQRDLNQFQNPVPKQNFVPKMRILRNKTLIKMQKNFRAMEEKEFLSLNRLAQLAGTTNAIVKGLISRGMIAPRHVRPSSSKGRQDFRYAFALDTVALVKKLLENK